MTSPEVVHLQAAYDAALAVHEAQARRVAEAFAAHSATSDGGDGAVIVKDADAIFDAWVRETYRAHATARRLADARQALAVAQGVMP